MFKKLCVLTVVLAFATGLSAIAFAEDKAVAQTGGPEVTVGGYVKMWIFDRPTGIGKVTGSGAGQMDLTKSYGVMFTEFDLSVRAKINELVSFIVEPKWSASTGATPKLGQIAFATPTPMAANDMGHGVAEMILNLPADITLEVGALRPLYSQEYGASMFFEEEMTCGKAPHDLMVVEDYGIGAAKTFSLGEITLPINLYILNGADGDFKFENNNEPGVMLHVEPSYGIVKLLGSVYASRYDNTEKNAKVKMLGGINVSWEGLTLRSEIAMDKIENKVAAGIDQIGSGYYVKLFYKVLPWLQLMYHYDHAVEGLSTGASDRGKTVNYLTNTLGSEIFLSDGTTLQINVDVGDWRTSDGVKTTVFTRPNIAVRSSF